MPGGLPVLLTKLVAPPERLGIIPRATLMAKLAAVPTRTVLVVAPAGYGKSTAIAQWAARDPRPVAWLSLDARDNDPYLLLNYVYVALAGITPIPSEVGVAIASGGPSIWTSAVPRLGAALAAAGHLVLILDDFDRVTDPDAADAILSLASHVPAGSQLILLGRTAGRLPMPRLIADGRLAVVGVADLAFDGEETGAVLQAAGVELAQADVERVAGHLEGWPAGVYLTARSLQAGRPWQLSPDDRARLGPPRATRPRCPTSRANISGRSSSIAWIPRTWRSRSAPRCSTG